MIDYYQLRPEQMEHVCLADFMALFDFVSINKKMKKNYIILNENQGYIKQRKSPKIIRYRKYNETEDPINYYREKLMLFHPWRNEEIELLNQNCEEIFKTNLNSITRNAIKYNDFENIIDEIDNTELKADIASESDTEIDDEEMTDNYRIYGLQTHDSTIDLEIPDLITNPNCTIKTRLTLLNDEDYYSLIRSLNIEQRQYLAHVMSNIIENNIFHECISGILVYI